MTRLRKSSYIRWIAVPLFCFASAAFAQTTTFEVEAPTGPLFGNFVYVSPYSAQIPAGQGPVVPAICDDWADEVSLTESWSAYATNLGSLTSVSGGSNLYYGANANGSSGLSQLVEYDTAAILSSALLNLPQGPWTPTNTEAQDAYSFAIWELFDGTGGASGFLQSLTSTNVGSASNPYTGADVASLASTFLSDAVSKAETLVATPGSQSAFSNVEIYSEACGNAVCDAGSGRAQEFIVVNMPEASSTMLLGFYLACSAFIAFVFRRRSSQRTS